RAARGRQPVAGEGHPRVQGGRDRQAARAARGPPAGAPGAAEERAKAEGAARAARVSPILALVGGHDGPLRCARWGRWWLPAIGCALSLFAPLLSTSWPEESHRVPIHVRG